MPGDPFRIDLPPHPPLRRAAMLAARPFLSWALALDTWRALYARATSMADTPFVDAALRTLEIGVRVHGQLGRVPERGGLIVVANHPHGALDGLVVASLIAKVRSDVRLLANHLLARIPELRDLCFFVDPFNGVGASARSRAGLRDAHLWLRQGGALVIFPAGEVAHEWRPDGTIADAPWRPTIGRLALATGARVLPVFIEGRNRRRFYASGRLHPLLRTLLLPRELLASRGRRVHVHVGEVLPATAAPLAGDAAAIVTDTARVMMEALGAAPQEPPPVAGGPHEVSSSPEQPHSESLRAEIARLPPSDRLLEQGAFQVFCVKAACIPHGLREIGRLRELTYRAAGEGTGRELDLDGFDAEYLHLFVWNTERNEIVGAYRIGQADRIVAASGIEGLYTRTLFRYDRRLIDAMTPALELGRSFVRPEYQRHHLALLLLWKGIGRFIVQHPQYRYLFGAVSISARYSDATRELLTRFLEQNHLHEQLAELVEPGHPPVRDPLQRRPLSVGPRDIDEVETLMTRTDGIGRRIPVLLRQYLKLNARLIGLTIDASFGNTLDALMIVDLTAVDQTMLRRYLGESDAASFLSNHRAATATQAA